MASRGELQRERSYIKRGAPESTQASKRRREDDAWLTRLTAEVTLKVFSCLSATDLASVSCVNRSCRELAAEAGLWRRLFLARWKEGNIVDESDSWKSRYFYREHQETNSVANSVTPEDRDMFLEMQKARRSLSLKPCSYQALIDASKPNPHPGLSEAALEWLKRHGFETTHIKELSLEPQTGPLVEIDDVFICETTGAVHCCDDRCQEQLLNTRLKQCPISGRTVPTFFFSQEENCRDDEEEDEMEECTGRLGRAFAAGYGCADEAELYRMWH